MLYGRETWTVKARDARRITAAEMKYMRITAGYTGTDYKTNTQNCKGVKNNTNSGQIAGIHEKLDNLNSVALVRERTIPTERPPPVGEVSAKFCG